ncbi:hypothetical protein JKP88DRAFT_350713 [Tribonema minus]|uniref:Uncharacterized protein n=1 Tax=Tribonema minus TaxID=303371 RepID=A0A835YL58_9STRA|nr:hypothetical protein JKP88DRAFT_350713 [Tribonema minus]
MPGKKRTKAKAKPSAQKRQQQEGGADVELLSERDLESGLLALPAAAAGLAVNGYNSAITNKLIQQATVHVESPPSAAALAKDNREKCHNLQPPATSRSITRAASTKWPWETLPQKAVREFFATAKDSVIKVTDAEVRQRIREVQCPSCRELLHGALNECEDTDDQVRLSKRIKFTIAQDANRLEVLTLVGVSGVDSLEALARIVETAVGGADAVRSLSEAPDSEAAAAAATAPAAAAAPQEDPYALTTRDMLDCLETSGLPEEPLKNDLHDDESLPALLEHMKSSRAHADLACSVVRDDAAAASGDAADDDDANWNPKSAAALQRADAALSQWLQYITGVLIAVGTLQSVAFLTGAGDGSRAADDVRALADGLWGAYEAALARLLDLALESREEQVKLQPQQPMMVLFLAPNLRRATARAVAARRAELAALHDHGALLSEPFKELDELARRALTMRIGAVSGDGGGSGFGGAGEAMAAQQTLDQQLVRVVADWDTRLDRFRDSMLAQAAQELSPIAYPQTPAQTDAMKAWRVEFDADWEENEQRRVFQSQDAQKQVNGHNEDFARVKHALKAAGEQQESLDKRRKHVAAAAAAGGAAAAAALSSRLDHDLTREEMEVTARMQELSVERQLAHQHQMGVKLNFRAFMVRLLQRRYWRTRALYARLRCLNISRARAEARLCGDAAAGLARLRLLLTVAALDAAGAAVGAWAAQRVEQQLLLEAEAEADAASARRRREAAARSSKAAAAAAAARSSGDGDGGGAQDGAPEAASDAAEAAAPAAPAAKPAAPAAKPVRPASAKQPADTVLAAAAAPAAAVAPAAAAPAAPASRKRQGVDPLAPVGGWDRGIVEDDESGFVTIARSRKARGKKEPEPPAAALNGSSSGGSMGPAVRPQVAAPVAATQRPPAARVTAAPAPAAAAAAAAAPAAAAASAAPAVPAVAVARVTVAPAAAPLVHDAHIWPELPKLDRPRARPASGTAASRQAAAAAAGAPPKAPAAAAPPAAKATPLDARAPVFRPKMALTAAAAAAPPLLKVPPAAAAAAAGSSTKAAPAQAAAPAFDADAASPAVPGDRKAPPPTAASPKAASLKAASPKAASKAASPKASSAASAPQTADARQSSPQTVAAAAADSKPAKGDAAAAAPAAADQPAPAAAASAAAAAAPAIIAPEEEVPPAVVEAAAAAGPQPAASAAPVQCTQALPLAAQADALQDEAAAVPTIPADDAAAPATPLAAAPPAAAASSAPATTAAAAPPPPAAAAAADQPPQHRHEPRQPQPQQEPPAEADDVRVLEDGGALLPTISINGIVIQFGAVDSSELDFDAPGSGDAAEACEAYAEGIPNTDGVVADAVPSERVVPAAESQAPAKAPAAVEAPPAAVAAPPPSPTAAATLPAAAAAAAALSPPSNPQSPSPQVQSPPSLHAQLVGSPGAAAAAAPVTPPLQQRGASDEPPMPSGITELVLPTSPAMDAALQPSGGGGVYGPQQQQQQQQLAPSGSSDAAMAPDGSSGADAGGGAQQQQQPGGMAFAHPSAPYAHHPHHPQQHRGGGPHAPMAGMVPVGYGPGMHPPHMGPPMGPPQMPYMMPQGGGGVLPPQQGGMNMPLPPPGGINGMRSPAGNPPPGAMQQHQQQPPFFPAQGPHPPYSGPFVGPHSPAGAAAMDGGRGGGGGRGGVGGGGGGNAYMNPQMMGPNGPMLPPHMMGMQQGMYMPFVPQQGYMGGPVPPGGFIPHPHAGYHMYPQHGGGFHPMQQQFAQQPMQMMMRGPQQQQGGMGGGGGGGGGMMGFQQQPPLHQQQQQQAGVPQQQLPPPSSPLPQQQQQQHTPPLQPSTPQTAARRSGGKSYSGKAKRGGMPRGGPPLQAKRLAGGRGEGIGGKQEGGDTGGGPGGSPGAPPPPAAPGEAASAIVGGVISKIVNSSAENAVAVFKECGRQSRQQQMEYAPNAGLCASSRYAIADVSGSGRAE